MAVQPPPMNSLRSLATGMDSLPQSGADLRAFIAAREKAKEVQVVRRELTFRNAPQKMTTLDVSVKSKFAEDVEAVQRRKSVGDDRSFNEQVDKKHDGAEQLERA